MSNQLVWKEYNKKIKLINYYNKKYYNNNISKISDSEYDSLKKEILELERKHNFLNHKSSPSKVVGHKPSRYFKKIAHKVPMLSLGNAFTEDDLKNFEKKILNFLSQNDTHRSKDTCEKITPRLSCSNKKPLNPISRY